MPWKQLKDVFTSIIVLPLLAGDKKLAKKYPNGSISIVILVIIWTALMAVIIPGNYRPYVSTYLTTEALTEIVLSLNLILGIVGCVAILATRAVKGISVFAIFRGKSFVLKLRLGFLLMFSFGTLFNAVITCMSNFKCLNSVDDLANWQQVSLNANLVYNILLGIFCLLEGLMFVSIVGYQLTSSKLAYVMPLLIGANLSVWVHAFGLTHMGNGNSTGKIEDINNCFEMNSEANVSSFETFVIDNVGSQLLTTLLQFSLLSINLIVEIWSPRIVLDTTHDTEETEESRLIPSSAEEDDQYYDTLTHAALYTRLDPSSENRRFSTYVVSLVAIGITIAYIVVCFIGVTTEQKDNYFLNWFPYLLFGYKSLMLLGYCFGFFCINQLAFNRLSWCRKFTAREIIMLVGVLFAFQFHFYKLLGGIFYGQKTALGVLLDACFSISLEYFQIVFILQVNKLENYNIKLFRRKSYLKECTALVMILSLGVWFTDSFIGTQFRGMHQEMEDGLGESAWKLVKFVIYPVLVFYRFTNFFAHAMIFQKL